MGKTVYSKDELLALSMQRFAAVSSGDLDATMAVLVDEPVFELHPAGLQLSGHADVLQYYKQFLASAGHAISGDIIDTFVSDSAVCLELRMTHGADDDTPEYFRMIAVQPVENGRFTGERLYGDERLFRLMFPNPVWSLFQPLEI